MDIYDSILDCLPIEERYKLLHLCSRLWKHWRKHKCYKYWRLYGSVVSISLERDLEKWFMNNSNVKDEYLLTLCEYVVYANKKMPQLYNINRELVWSMHGNYKITKNYCKLLLQKGVVPEDIDLKYVVYYAFKLDLLDIVKKHRYLIDAMPHFWTMTPAVNVARYCFEIDCFLSAVSRYSWFWIRPEVSLDLITEYRQKLSPITWIDIPKTLQVKYLTNIQKTILYLHNLGLIDHRGWSHGYLIKPLIDFIDNLDNVSSVG